MGFFGGYVLDGGRWREFDPQDGQVPVVTATWLSVCVYDSDIAEVRYEPAGPGSGTAFLGFTPRAYYEDESASAPADVAREAAGLASWVARPRGPGRLMSWRAGSCCTVPPATRAR